jgi:hypothetical protein
MRLLHIILLVIYCHFTMAGTAGMWVMKQSFRTEDRSPLAVTDQAGDGEDADGDEPSPVDPDQWHGTDHFEFTAIQSALSGPAFFPDSNGKASIRPIDILTPPPKA